MAESTRFDVRLEEGVALLGVCGELDMAARDDYEKARDEALATGLPIVFDLRECSFVDSDGIAGIMRAFKLATHDGRGLALAGSGPQIGRMLDLTGLATLIPCFDSLEEAVEHVRAPGALSLADPAANGAGEASRTSGF